MHGHGLFRDDLSCIRQLLRGLKLSFGMNNLGPPFPLRLRLLSHSPLHLLWQINVLQLNQNHLNPPRIGLNIKNLLNPAVNPFPLGQKLV